MLIEITHDPIDPDAVRRSVGGSHDGAVLLFLGTVRNHNDGRTVDGMEYEAYEEMASEVLRAIAEEAATALGTDRVAVVHRIGSLAVGEVSVAIAVSSPHRAQAYDASRYAIEEIKKRLPVWKREHYTDGERSWVRGQTPRPVEEKANMSEPPSDGRPGSAGAERGKGGMA
jgi:molybdopterin synthase catalytic subunit